MKRNSEPTWTGSAAYTPYETAVGYPPAGLRGTNSSLRTCCADCMLAPAHFAFTYPQVPSASHQPHMLTAGSPPPASRMSEQNA